MAADIMDAAGTDEQAVAKGPPEAILHMIKKEPIKGKRKKRRE